MSDQEPIDLECPECKKKLRVPATAVGKRIRCPACSVVINVPAETRHHRRAREGSPQAATRTEAGR